MGRWVGEVRRLTGSLQAEVQDVVDEVMRPVNETATVATESFSSTFATEGVGAIVEVDDPDTSTAASPSVASSEPALPAPPADPSLN